MPDEPIDRTDQAYLEASRTFDDAASAARRREAVLAAVAKAVPAAANEARWRPAAWWRGAAAACVLLGSALVVTKLADEPAAMAPASGGDALQTSAPAAIAAAPTPAPTPMPATTAPAMKASRAERAEPTHTLATPVSAQQVPVAAPAADEPVQAKAAAPSAALSPPPALAHADAAAAAAPTPIAAPESQAPAQAAKGRIAPAMGPAGANRSSARLQSAGPDDERDVDGRTALAQAVLRGDVAAAQRLLARGADRLAKDRFGRTPQDYAQAGGDTAMLQVFGWPAASPGTLR